jgi:hypothetical protein
MNCRAAFAALPGYAADTTSLQPRFTAGRSNEVYHRKNISHQAGIYWKEQLF